MLLPRKYHPTIITDGISLDDDDDEYDDKQVVSLNAIKTMDSRGLCRGATEVEISVLEEGDL